MNYWLMKTEPTTYSWDNLVEDGTTTWEGVRNYQARNNLAAMKKGDQVFIYHSVKEKAIVGIAKVIKEAYPDSTTKEAGWIVVDIAPVKALARPITLQEIKTVPQLKTVKLLSHSRLSVMPITKQEFEIILKLSTIT